MHRTILRATLVAAVVAGALAGAAPSGALVATDALAGPVTGHISYGAALSAVPTSTISAFIELSGTAVVQDVVDAQSSTSVEPVTCAYVGGSIESLAEGVSTLMDGQCETATTGIVHCDIAYVRVGVVAVIEGACAYRNLVHFQGVLLWTPGTGTQADVAGVVSVIPG